MDLFSIVQTWPHLFHHLDQTITLDRAAAWFRAIADTHAPSQTARYTRGPVMRALLGEAGTPDTLRFHDNLWKTGSVAVELGRQAMKPIWMLAHLDEISYALDRAESGRYRLFPLCYHMIRSGRRDGLALGYTPGRGGLHALAFGQIVTEGDTGDVFFETPVGGLPRGTRIVYHYPAEISQGTMVVHAHIDNAFGCAALLLAALALAPYQPEALIVFPDEEEGRTGDGNQSFCKGSSRLFNRCPVTLLPDIVVVSDVHESEDMANGPGARSARPGGGATFCELSSRGRGGVTPPSLVAFHHDLTHFLATHGVRLQENVDGYVSRSDSVSAMMFVQHIALVGYLGSHRHFDATPEAYIGDLVHLAKTLAVYALVAQNPEWAELCLR